MRKGIHTVALRSFAAVVAGQDVCLSQTSTRIRPEVHVAVAVVVVQSEVVCGDRSARRLDLHHDVFHVVHVLQMVRVRKAVQVGQQVVVVELVPRIGAEVLESRVGDVFQVPQLVVDTGIEVGVSGQEVVRVMVVVVLVVEQVLALHVGHHQVVGMDATGDSPSPLCDRD